MVYVDTMNQKYRRMVMCHMVADTQEELFEMCDKIGVARKWVQDYGTPREHFDICLSKKKKAIEHGAMEIGWRQLFEITKAKENESSKV